MKRNTLFVFTLALLLSQVACTQVSEVNPYSGSKSISLDSPIDSPVTITIIYDNYIHTEGMKEDWGYSCYIDGLEKKILFDTGTRPDIFRHNFLLAGLKAENIDEVFLSHEHGDHTGGLSELLKMSTDFTVVAPETFSNNFFKDVLQSGAEMAKISDPVEICSNLFSTGVMGTLIPEQALVMNTHDGLIVMTGCSHPGIIEMLTEIKLSYGKDIYMVFGGFHLMNKTEQQMSGIINDMKELGVSKCGATHCTGEKQIEMFRQAFGENFVIMGTGNSIVFN